jgi:hypothetical protein
MRVRVGVTEAGHRLAGDGVDVALVNRFLEHLSGTYCAMALRLACSGSEAVDLEAAGDPDDAGLIFAGGEVAGLLGGSWAGPVGSVADEEGRVEDLEQEGGEGQVKILRGESPP